MVGIFLCSNFMYLQYMNKHSHITIIGAGLAGLTSAIHLAKAGIFVVLIEKDTYPRHKVCGEYISNEVLPYFSFLDIDIDSLKPVPISKFCISTQKGNSINCNMPLGGFGISRYTLDNYLWEKAKKLGVLLINNQVTDIEYQNNIFTITTSDNQELTSDYVIGAYGKRTQLDKTLKRSFAFQKSPWLAIKAHYKADIASDTVALHNFSGGYCGISMVENNTVNTCYLVSYDSFKKYKNIAIFQKEVLYKNPFLKKFFLNAKPLFEASITIGQINFEKKEPVKNHIFMTGDAAGLIHPLCGNGMAMAIQSAKILSELLISSYDNTSVLNRTDIEKQYHKKWKDTFYKRLYTGRVLQKVLLNENLQYTSYLIANAIPFIVPKIIKQTHGEPLVCL